MRALVLGLLLTLAAVASTGAARAEDEATRAAKRHYVKGDKLFALGKFDQALVEFEAAYQAKPLPKLLFNIGQAHRNLDHHDQAIFAFRKYLRELPDADNREAVEKLIDELEQRKADEAAERRRQAELERERALERDRAARAAERGRDKPIYTRWWFWGGIAAVAGASAGGYLLLRDDRPSTDLGNVVFD